MLNPLHKIGKFIKQDFKIFTLQKKKIEVEVVSGEVNGYFGLHTDEDGNLTITYLPSGKLVIYSDFDALSLEAPNRKAYQLPEDEELEKKFKEMIARLNSLKFMKEEVIPSDEHFKIRTILRFLMYYDEH